MAPDLYYVLCDATEITVINIPLSVQIVGSAVSFALLWVMGSFSDHALPNCGWAGHQCLEISQTGDNIRDTEIGNL